MNTEVDFNQFGFDHMPELTLCESRYSYRANKPLACPISVMGLLIISMSKKFRACSVREISHIGVLSAVSSNRHFE